MKTLNHKEQLIAMSRENDALVDENRQLRGYVAELEAKQHELEMNAFSAWQREMKAIGELNELRNRHEQP